MDIILIVLWVIVGIINLLSDKIKKADYALLWVSLIFTLFRVVFRS